MKALFLLGIAAAAPGDWPQWRGPDRNGISNETGWSAEGKADAVWSKNVGLGYSSVTVAAGRLYTLGFDEEKGLDSVYCLDAKTGEEIWSHSFPAKIWNHLHRGGTLTTPSIDGDVVYALNREGNFFCFDAATGEVKWKKALKEELELEYPTWGFSASPLILDDKLVLNLGKTFALDKETGKVLWESKHTGHAYSTPVDFALEGRPSLAVFNSNGFSVVDLADGEQRYFHEWKTQYDVNIATPVVVGGNRVFISSGLNRGCAMLEVGGESAEVVWESKKMRTKLTGCVLFEDHLYGFDESAFKCLGLDGEVKWSQRGLGDGAFVLADGKLILVSSKGELAVAKATPAGYEELSRTKVLDGGVYWTSPVLADGMIYVRNSLGDLVCRDHRAGER